MAGGEHVENQSSCSVSNSSPTTVMPSKRQTSQPCIPCSPLRALPAPFAREECSHPPFTALPLPSSHKRRKLKSAVWNHFEKMIVDGLEKAQCLRCGQLLSATSKNGTSHLKDHINIRCSKKDLTLDLHQPLLNWNSKLESSDVITRVETHPFNQELSLKELINMVVMHEYPLSIVDHIGFKRFIVSLNPNFKFITREILKDNIMEMFATERAALKKLFQDHDGRIAITVDMWTASHQKRGYMVVTSHFIDHQWVLRNRTLRVAHVPCPQTKEVLARVLFHTLDQYNIAEKTSVVVVDNCSVNDAMVQIFRERIGSEYLMVRGDFFHILCGADLLNMLVQDALNVIGTGIERIRSCVWYWSSNAKRIDTFECKARSLRINCSRKLVLGCKTRWNSTYLMLQSALQYKEVFAMLKTQDPDLLIELPSDDEWNLAAIVYEKLETFYKATKLFSGRTYATANLFFCDVCEIKIALNSWVSSPDQVIRDMSASMVKKFDRYWSTVNGILAIAAIFDPRKKLECVEFYFNEIYGDMAFDEVERVKSLLYDILYEYQEKAPSSSEDHNSNVGVLGKKHSRSTTDPPTSQASTIGIECQWSLAKKNIKKKANLRFELDHYLNDPVLPESDQFDVLVFWKNDLKHPNLSKIARDVLAIPAAIVASESAFDVDGRTVSPHRSKLHVDTVEALMCMRSWITEGHVDDAQACATFLEDLDVDLGGKVTSYDDDQRDIYLEMAMDMDFC